MFSNQMGGLQVRAYLFPMASTLAALGFHTVLMVPPSLLSPLPAETPSLSIPPPSLPPPTPLHTSQDILNALAGEIADIKTSGGGGSGTQLYASSAYAATASVGSALAQRVEQMSLTVSNLVSELKSVAGEWLDWWWSGEGLKEE